MTTWTNAPPQTDERRSFQLMRTPASGGLRMVILSTAPVGILLHYWKGRTTPCNAKTCEACKSGQRPRWKGFLLVRSLKGNQIKIFEYTERAHPTIEDTFKSRNTLRGSVISARRMGTRPNSPLIIEFDSTTMAQEHLDPEASVQEMLERMWEVRQQPLPQFDQNDLHETLPPTSPK